MNYKTFCHVIAGLLIVIVLILLYVLSLAPLFYYVDMWFDFWKPDTTVDVSALEGYSFPCYEAPH